jgi:hypothetical protein
MKTSIMKFFVALLSVVLLLSLILILSVCVQSCNNSGPAPAASCEETHTVAERLSEVSSRPSLFSARQIVYTNYYLVSADGFVLEVSLGEYVKYKVGARVRACGWRR